MCAQLDEARRIFRKAGIETELQNTTAPGEATDLARRAVDAIAATRHRLRRRRHGERSGERAGLQPGAAGRSARREPPTSWRKSLSLPWNLPRAAERIARAPYRRIALGLAIPEKSSGEPRYFLSVAGAGADGALVSAVRPEIKLKAGILAYWQEGFRQLTRYDFPLFRTMMAGEPDRRLRSSSWAAPNITAARSKSRPKPTFFGRNSNSPS